MPTLETPSAEELDAQSTELQEALNATWALVGGALAAELAAQATVSAASAGLVPALWARYSGRVISKLLNIYLTAADRVAAAVERETGRAVDALDVVHVLRWATAARERLDRSAEVIETKVRELLSADDSRDNVIAAVRDYLTAPIGHSEVVAHTETHAAVQSATHTQFASLVESGVVVVTRTWQSRHDDRVRSWHREADGQRRELNEPFAVGDSFLIAPSVPVPGLPFDVGDICNCRCGVRYSYDIIKVHDDGDTREVPVPDLEPGEAALVAASAKWNPEDHPRGKDGKFIKKGFLQLLLSSKKPWVSHTIHAVKNLDAKQWNNLKPEQQDYVKDAVDKLPHDSEMYKTAKKKLDSLSGANDGDSSDAPAAAPKPQPSKIPAHKGAMSGTPAKISTALIWGKYEPGTVILHAEDDSGQSQVVWNGKKYDVQKAQPGGEFKTVASYSKKDAYANLKKDTHWKVPSEKSSSSTATSDSSPAATPPATPSPATPSPATPSPATPSPATPSPATTTSTGTTSGPVHVSPTVDPASGPLGVGGDISGISNYAKAIMKDTLKSNKVGYWSKPEKIWDSVLEVQKKFPDPDNPGSSKYSALQVLKALDSTLKTSNPSPFETKMTKWAASSKGQSYIQSKSVLPTAGAPAPTPSAAPAATKKKFPSVTDNFSYPSAWAQGKPITNTQVINLLKSSEHLDIVGVHVKGSIQHRIVRSSDDPDTGEMRFYVQMRDDATTGGWDVVAPAGNPTGLMKTADDLSTYFPGMKFRSVEGVVGTAPTPASKPKPKPKPLTVPVSQNGDDISHLTEAQKNKIFSSFKAQSGTFLSSPELSIFKALQTTAKANNLSVMQVLKTVDEVGAKKAGTANANLFQKKISTWLNTKQGTIAASGVGMSAALARKVDFSPGVSLDKIPSFDESSKLSYKVMKVSEAHKFEKEVLKQGSLPASQTNALRAYTGGVYLAVNSYLYGGTDTISSANMNIAKNVQKAMRPSDRPILLHRGVSFDGIANSTGYDDLKSKEGQTWMSGGFFSTSVGGTAAFSQKPVLLEIEAPPGTPMAWMERQVPSGTGDMKPLTKYPGENEMLLGAGLSFRIVKVTKKATGKTVVRLRVVPPSEEVTV